MKQTAHIEEWNRRAAPSTESASPAEGAKPAAWVTPLLYGEQVTFYKPPAPAPGEDDEWYCYPLFRHPAPSACGVADSAAESDPCPHCEGSGRSACWNCDGTGRRHDNIRDSFNLAHAQSADRWDGKHWLEGTAGGCNIVTYNGEDVVGVGYIANDNAREQVIADHNARLDAQSADTPSEAPLDICGRPAQLLADPDDYV